MNDALSHDSLSRDAAPVVDTPAGLASNDRTLAAAAHLAPLVAALATSWFAGVAGALAALVVWLLVRDRSAFAAAHAKEALNFNFSMFLYAVASIVLVVFTLGIGLIVAVPLWIGLAIAWLVFTIVASVKAYDGETYRYPLTIRLF
ncbi:MAG: DUF4870 domain-containing protein [Lysobacteraceae bacterium]